MSDNGDLLNQQNTDHGHDSVSNFQNETIIPIGQSSSSASRSISTPLSRSISSSAQAAAAAPQIVSFHRTELNEILNVYGFKVASGEWRDYAIDMLKDKAIFSIYRKSREIPLHCIEKNPKLSRKQGIYSVTGADGRVLKRGHDLTTVLKVLEKKPKLTLV